MADHESPGVDNLGRLVGERYLLERELARGGMGVVYVAEDTKLSLKVAVKLASTQGRDSQAFRERFRREAQIGSLLGRQEGFVRATDWGEDSEHLYLAMDLVEDALSLDLTSGTVEERATRLAAAAELVARARELGVVHRDLKPENFLVSPAGEVSLADFGLAKLLGEDSDECREDLEQSVFESYRSMSLTQTGAALGTPLFMAPEQFEDAKGADERADVYSLGTMLFFALTGRYPYEGKALHEIRAQQVRVECGTVRAPSPRDHAPGVPAHLDQLCVAATAIKPAKRPTSVRLFLEALRRDPLDLPKAETEVKPPKAELEADPPTPAASQQPVRDLTAGERAALIAVFAFLLGLALLELLVLQH